MRPPSPLLAVAVLCAACGDPIVIEPAAPRTTDDLRVRVPPRHGELRWWLEDALVHTGPVLPSALTAKGDRWRVEHHHAGTRLGEAEVVIVNSPPSVRVQMPEVMLALDAVLPEVELTDADGDRLDWSVQWARDGELLPAPQSLGLPVEALIPGHAYTLTITADDGEATTTVERTLRVLDTAGQRPGDWLFAEGSLHPMQLTLSDADANALRDRPDEWAHADLQVGGRAVFDVGVRLKGNGSFQPLDEKPSLVIDLDRWKLNQRLDGLTRFVLNNGSFDPSGLREQLAYTAYRELGVPAPRAVPAEVLLPNADAPSLYTLVEAVDAQLLARWFEHRDGPLYELFDVDFAPDTVADFDHDGGPDDRTTLAQLAELLTDPEVSFTDDLTTLVDRDAWVDYLAVSAVIGQFDAYPWSFPGDDLYVYVDPLDARLRFLPHGADETFNDPDRPVDYLFGRLGRACLDDPDCRQAWITRTFEACAEITALDLPSRAEALFDQTAPTRDADPRAGPWVITPRGSVDLLKDFLEGRCDRLAAMPGLQ